MFYLTTVLKGIIMGIVETIPGVSGSTLALIMGIYENFIDLLHDTSSVLKEITKFLLGKSSFNKIITQIKKIDMRFGVLLFFGMFLGVGVFSHVMSFSLDKYPQYTFAFFFGLILVSIRVPWGFVKEKNSRILLLFALSFVLTYVLLGAKPIGALHNPSRLLLFLGGFFAICSMILPGISGSFVLLLFGLYDYAIEAVKNLTTLSITYTEFTNLVVLGFGVIFGFATFVRLLKKALVSYKPELMTFLTALMLASLRVLWPFMDPSTSGSPETMKKVLPWQIDSLEMWIIIAIVLTTGTLIHALHLSITRRELSKAEETEAI